MIEVRKTEVFVRWLDGLHDIRARARILVRIERLAAGNPGDVEPVGGGISELRINYGPGYRVYYKQFGKIMVILLAGGDKSTRAKDISKRSRGLINMKRRIVIPVCSKPGSSQFIHLHEILGPGWNHTGVTRLIFSTP